MIDPRNITKFDRNEYELEEFLLFSIVVAGKNAFVQANKLDQFLTRWKENEYSPLAAIRTMNMDGTLIDFLRQVKMGQYQRISTAFRGLGYFLNYDAETERHHPLRKINIKYLECIRGIGMKTARFFVLHSRANQQVACLDTHILQWLGVLGHEVPKTTPSGEKYLALEKVFLDYCKKLGMLPADLDLKIWNEAQAKKS